MRAAAVQLNSTDDRDRNLEVAERLVREAASGGAELIVLPEKWPCLGSPEALLEAAEPLDGPVLNAVAGWASELGAAILAGSVGERIEGSEKIANTSVLIGRDGTQLAAYRKIHMFDVDVAGVEYRESAHEQPGTDIVVGDVDALKLGLSVCYDLRFPELFRILALSGAHAIALPAAFTERTGRDHWEPLIRARAIENQLFMIAAGQIGEAPPHYRSFGRSMIVDPWGLVMAQAPDTECVISAQLDLEAMARIRSSIPSLANRRPGAYEWPEGQAPRAKAVG